MVTVKVLGWSHIKSTVKFVLCLWPVLFWEAATVQTPSTGSTSSRRRLSKEQWLESRRRLRWLYVNPAVRLYNTRELCNTRQGFGCSQSQHHKPFGLFNGAPRVPWFQRRSAETCLSTSEGICFQLGGAWNIYCFCRAATNCWGIRELLKSHPTHPG